MRIQGFQLLFVFDRIKLDQPICMYDLFCPKPDLGHSYNELLHLFDSCTSQHSFLGPQNHQRALKEKKVVHHSICIRTISMLLLYSGTFKGPISSEKYWYYFNCPKNVLYTILSFEFSRPWTLQCS